MSEETPEALPALYAELERINAEAVQWASVEASESTALVQVGSADPEKVREQMLAVRREARERANELEMAAAKVKRGITREVDRQREAMYRQQSEMEAQMKAALAALAPLQEQVKRMEEGIWTVNLYLGTSEEIVTLREGKPTSVDTPLHLRTSVLAMDEEVASFPRTANGRDWQGMDFKNLADFDEWLVEDPEHLAQCLPEERGIVVFTPRRSDKVYHEDPLINAMANEPNHESYWLIRNGENLYRLSTDFKVGRNLMPLTSEFTALFRSERYDHKTGTYETVEVLPGTQEWEDAEKAQDGKRRHFMRVALILQGLVDRTDLFKPIHAGVNFMHQRTYDEGYVVVINDTERALTTSREPYSKWIKRLNVDLRPGQRVIGTYRGSEWDQYEFTGDRWSTAEGNQRLSPARAERPPENTLLLIEARRKFQGQYGLVVKYPRTEAVYDPKMWVPSPDRPGWGHYGGDRVPKTRASAVILPTDTSIIPFDLVTVEEMEAYLNARTERHAYAKMFPLLQAAIAAKHAEAKAEEPFRDLLMRVLADDNGQTLDEVAPHINDLVHRYKLGNKWHRPLVSLSSEDEAKAIRLIRGEYKRIVGSGADEDRDANAVAALRKHDADVMFVGRLSSGKYVAFAPQPRVYPEGTVSTDLWVREHATGKTARTIASRDWIIPGVRGAKMTTLYSDKRWEGWNTMGTAKDDVTDDEMAALIEQAKRECLPALRATYGQQVEFLAVGHDRKRRSVVVFVHDGVHGAPTRAMVSEEKFTSRWMAASITWGRKDGEVVAKRAEHRQRDAYTFHDDYALGDRGDMWNRTPDDERPMKMPWDDTGYYDPKPVLIEVDNEVLAMAERVMRDARKVNRTVDELKRRINPVGRWIEQQQIAAKVEVIKAKFLTEYPDEEMWEERRQGLTQGVRADVDVTDRHHLHVRKSMGKGSYSLHERTDGLLTIDQMLAVLIDAGYIEWDGLTVGDAYELAGLAFPDYYERVRNLLIAEPKPEPVEEVGEPDEEDDDEAEEPEDDGVIKAEYTMTVDPSINLDATLRDLDH